ncbi:hypothetical protein [Spongiactinospora sp. TRM90649]|uniref:hypothetical protein n=1 Tax=Spongiactinospora sp. TRM90649 TaxID=3031114 RepID=UPI0023F769AC|nr:hypothetical protein [Spongiactinospora sp. TRM90649]MDF5754937.1 hypothetical protein [Spongiactinospora sp. TRM90649]
MKRRTFVAGTVGVAAGVAVVPSSALAWNGPVGTPHPQELRAGLGSLVAMDSAHGGGDVRALAARHLARIRRVIDTGTYSDAIGRKLRLLAGEMAEHCGWYCFDDLDHPAARSYWAESLATARMLEDRDLEVVVLASLSLQALREEHSRYAYDLARAARRRAEAMDSPMLLSIIAAREARALAQMGDHTAAQGELARAMKLYERADRGRPAPTWTAFHGPAELSTAQGLVYLEAGRYQAAASFFRAASAQCGDGYGRNRALYQLSLAGSLVRAGEVDEGAGQAVTGLRQLKEVSCGRATERVKEVRDLLTTVDTATAREGAEALSRYAA